MKINTKLKSLTCLILVILTLLSSTLGVFAHDAYFLGVGFDTDTYSYYGTYTFQSNLAVGDNHNECAISCVMYQVSKPDHRVPVRYGDSSNNDIEEIKDIYKSEENAGVAVGPGLSGGFNYVDTHYSDNSDPLMFTFPSMHTKNIKTDKLDASAADAALADRVSSIIIPQLNEAINFCYDVTGVKKTSVNVRRTAADLSNLARTQGVDGDSSASAEALCVWDETNETTDTTTQRGWVDVNPNLALSDLPKEIRESMPPGITADDYVHLSYDGNDDGVIDAEGYFIYQCWKGYNYPAADGSSTNNLAETNGIVDPLARDTQIGNWYEKEGLHDNYKIGWNHIVLQGNMNLDVYGTSFSNLGDLMPTNWLIEMLADLLMWCITSVRSFLGLYSMEDLMLNSGTRNMFYSMGLFHNNWVAPIYLMHIICQLIAWCCLGFAVMKILMKRQLATVNIGEKVSMMNDLKNLAVCAFLLGSFPLLFNMVARINYSLVDLFNSISGGGQLLGNSTISLSSLGSIVIEIANLLLEAYFNFTYMLRSITIAVLYAIAPLCIYTLALGGKYSKVYGAFMKELLSNIFIQTIHALMIAFFISVKSGVSFRPFESVIILYSFIPLTKFVKQNVFQMGDGIMGGAAGLAGGLAKAGGAALGSATGAASKAIGPKGKSGGAGGGAGGKGGTIGRSADLASSRKGPKNFSSDSISNSFKDAGANWKSGKPLSAAKDLAATGGKKGFNAVNNFANSKAGHVMGDTIKGAAGGLVGGLASNALGAGVSAAGGMTKMAMGVGSLALGDEQLASQMIADGASSVGTGIGSVAGGVGQGINGAVSSMKGSIGAEMEAMKQLQSIGAKKLTRDKHKNTIDLAGTYSGPTKNRHIKWDPKTANKMSPTMQSNLDKMVRAFDGTSGMDETTAAKIQSWYARQGVRGVRPNSQGDITPQIELDKGVSFDKINWNCPIGETPSGRQKGKSPGK